MDETLSRHPTDSQLDEFVQRSAPVTVLLDIDRHLGDCEQCRARVASRAPLGRMAASVREQILSGAGTEDHLDYEDVAALAEGRGNPAAQAHARRCESCRGEVEDLRAFMSSRARRAIAPRWWMAAAAAIAAIVSIGIYRTVADRPAPLPPIASLQDESGVWTVQRDGTVHGGVRLSRADGELLSRTLRSGKLPISPAAAQLGRGPEMLLGGRRESAPFSVLQPVGGAVINGSILFSWTALAGASWYRVSVYDQAFREVAHSPDLRNTSWLLGEPLAPERDYGWTVTARSGSRVVRVPAPPAPEARFFVLSDAESQRLRQAASAYPQAHLLLAALYAQAGVFTEARDQLAALARSNPHSELLRELQASLPADQKPSPNSSKPAQ